MDPYYINIFDTFSNTRNSNGWQTSTRRGSCGITTTAFFNYLLNIPGQRFNIVKIPNNGITIIHDNIGNKYFKRLSFNYQHYAILISNYGDSVIHDDDYILDFTYKQMIVNGTSGAAAARSASLAAVNVIERNAPDYLLLHPSEIQGRFSTPKWQTNYVNPNKSVISAARNGMRGAGSRKRKTRRHSKK